MTNKRQIYIWESVCCLAFDGIMGICYTNLLIQSYEHARRVNQRKRGIGLPKNVIFMHIDSLNYQRLFASACRPADNAPFMHRLMAECVSCPQLYSQAPYTEAAIKALMAGRNTLDDGGYLEGFSPDKTILYEELQKNGYMVYSNWYPNITPYSQRRGVEYPYYAVNFEFEALWNYRLKYYRDIQQAGELNARDMTHLIALMEDNLSEWKRFLAQCASQDAFTEIVRDNLTGEQDAQDALQALCEQIDLFEKDKPAYITGVLSKAEQHPLFAIPVFRLHRKLKDPGTEKRVRDKYGAFLKRCQRFNRNRNLWNNRLSLPLLGRLLGRAISRHSRQAVEQLIRYLYNYKKCIGNDGLLYRIQDDYSNHSDSLSARGFVDHFLRWHDEGRVSDRPFFAYIQLSDFHYRESFFTYDTDDMRIIDEDFASLQAFFAQLPKTYKGALSSDFSLVYIDRCMQYFFEQLEQRGLLENTAVILSSDHGFTFGFDPVRPTTLINFHEENYHIPFLLYDRSLSPGEIRGLHSSCDVPATILDLCGIEKPAHFVGESMLKPGAGHSIIHMEFMGAGCPDMDRRPVMLAARSQRYKAAFRGRLNEEFEQGDLYELYDLQSDPREMKNLARRRDYFREAEVQAVVTSLRERFYAIREDYASGS